VVRALGVLLALGAVLSGPASSGPVGQGLLVAAAADLRYAFEEMGDAFRPDFDSSWAYESLGGV
jgi:ABC-type molybdate transport system substrate-binding protein